MNKKTLILTICLAMLSGLLIGLKLITGGQKALAVVNVSPENQSQNITAVRLDIAVDFNRPLKNQQEIQFNISPQINSLTFGLENGQQTLVVTSQEPLSANTVYSFEIKDKKNQLLSQINFKTEVLAGDPLIPYQEKKDTAENYPLLQYIPYETAAFSVSYSGPLALKVKIRQGNQKEIEKEVKDWLKSKGIEPSTHQIEFVAAAVTPAL